MTMAKRYVRLTAEEAVKAKIHTTKETKRGIPIGVVAAMVVGNEVRVGWSICHRLDQFSYDKANSHLADKLNWKLGQRTPGKCQYVFPLANLQDEITGPTGSFGNSIKFEKLDETYRRVLRDIDYRLKLASGEIQKKDKTSPQASS